MPILSGSPRRETPPDGVLRATLLGTGASFGTPVLTCRCATCTSTDPRDVRSRASLLLERGRACFLVDPGPDMRGQCLRAQVDRIDGVWITHGHADHVGGIDDLRPFCKRDLLEVRGSRETLEEVRNRFSYAFAAPHDDHGVSRPQLRATEIVGPFEALGMRVVPVPVFHGPFPVLGFRLGNFAYLTDCSEIPESSMPLLQGVEVLVLSALREAPHPTHAHFDLAVQRARDIGARQTWFTHFAHDHTHAEMEARFPADMRPAWDGLALDVAL